MLLEALRRAETAVKEAFALASAGGVSCGELRDALVVTKTVAGVIAAAQTQLASAVAKAERHGDGGTGVLAEMDLPRFCGQVVLMVCGVHAAWWWV